MSTQESSRVAVTIRVVHWDDSDGEALRRAQRRELDIIHENDNHEPGGPPSGEDIAVFLVAYDEQDIACACGALRQLDATSAEIKRMYVHPAIRGRGVSSAILAALESQATQRGWSTLRLETGTRMPGAIRFYEREGYTKIASYGVYAGVAESRCFEKRFI